ncbi:penicillin acylase family protein [Deinococcus irradiatisoli]|uniref:Penicillin acylase family protein n=1 Tax=Deinococcus irradiatisoli TaxID=2202254 RepID=A0A2Z3JGR9_9DEIO|nr:penicillin acylase family protein [Deinococcus irradiatisoli]AWN24185.1 penicillin acylase family protein [Deinococcus irradiatisoli]
MRVLRAFGVFVLALLLLAAAGAIYLNVVTNPRLSGELNLPGLQGPVTITRDRWGVPHIVAERSDADAVYALGFVHAQDRLWQMEFQRRISQGRLSEVLGAAALPQDKFLRTWGFYRAAQSVLPALSLRSRALVSAYTRGVNAGMAQQRLPLEFRILGYTPEPWTDVDSVAWSKLMAYDLGGNWDQELLGAQVAQKLGPGALNQIMPPYPAGAPTILSADELPQGAARPSSAPTTATLPAGAIAALRAQLAAARSLGFVNAPGKGSNDWVIGGERTVSGKPILADDPHLGLSAPMLWYLADIKGPTLHAIGASLPGLPAIVIGRNDRVAWGVTNVNPDVQDLYIEPASAPLNTRTEIIKVKNQPDVRLTVQESVHGSIISGVNSDLGQLSPRVALRWTALLPGDTTMDAFMGLNYARNWQDFTQALSSYVAPSQNFVYGDIDGNTGYYAPGRVPIRRSPDGWDGSLPAPGDGQHEWTGYIPFNGLPHTFNPADHLIVTANNKVVPDSYPSFLGNIRNWAEPYRAERITELLSAKAKLTVDDVKATQLDTVSLVWRDLKPYLLATRPEGELSRQALELLRPWNGDERADQVAPMIFEAWLMQLQTLAQDELGNGDQLESLAVLNALKSHSQLCAVNGEGDCAAWLSRTLKAAVSDLQTRLGDDPAGWTYGKLHRVADNHQAFGNVKAIGWLFNRSAPTSGGTNTVNVARPTPGSYTQTHAPSYRQIVDFSDLNKSLFVGTLGQGGNPIGPHYADQLRLWQQGEYLPMSSDPNDWGRTRVLNLRSE